MDAVAVQRTRLVPLDRKVKGGYFRDSGFRYIRSEIEPVEVNQVNLFTRQDLLDCALVDALCFAALGFSDVVAGRRRGP